MPHGQDKGKGHSALDLEEPHLQTLLLLNLTVRKNYFKLAEGGKKEASQSESKGVFQMLRGKGVTTWLGINSWNYEIVGYRGL